MSFTYKVLERASATRMHLGDKGPMQPDILGKYLQPSGCVRVLAEVVTPGKSCYKAGDRLVLDI